MKVPIGIKTREMIYPGPSDEEFHQAVEAIMMSREDKIRRILERKAYLIKKRQQLMEEIAQLQEIEKEKQKNKEAEEAK